MSEPNAVSVGDAPGGDAEHGPVLRFPDGVPGFPGARHFVLVEVAEGSPIQLLRSLDVDGLEFVVAVPWSFFPDYAPDLEDTDAEQLGIDSPDDAIVFCTIALDADSDEAYMNLLGPFVVNARTHEGRQVVLRDTSQPLRAPLPLGD